MGHAHTSEDVFSTRMRNILRIANSLKEITSFSYSPGHSALIPTRSPVVTNSISLPIPSPLLPLLLGAGVDHEVATAASKIYEQRAQELRKHIEECVETAARKIAELPMVESASTPDLLIRKMVLTATEVYLQRLEQWKEDIIQRIEQVSKLAVKAAVPKTCRPFNYEYIPLLERFFKENPFPTHADKMFLAKKSSMEYRQIHVWFQNRRTRTKKEGKALKKKPTCEGMKQLDNNYDNMKSHMVSYPQFPKAGSPEDANETEVIRDAFVLSPPPHAFPSPYPPVCHYDPFPCRSGFVRFDKPEWRRARGKTPISLSPSIDELSDKFSRLNVRDETRSSNPLSHAATAAITIVPSRAPHPSLIHRKYRQTANAIQCHPIVRASISSLEVLRNFNPSSTPVTLVPPVSDDRNELTSERKTAPLPRCFPGRIRNTCRNSSPSENSSTSSASPRLYSPDFESQNRTSISSQSTPSEIKNTQELPHLSDSSSHSPFDG